MNITYPNKVITIILLMVIIAFSIDAKADGADNNPLVRNIDRCYSVTKGLEGRHIALWGSHGKYFELGDNRWEWQRPRLLETTEDKFPSSYILQYVTPMLENAGAIVLMPRERDTCPIEIVVDNDFHFAKSDYHEKSREKKWQFGETEGFGYVRNTYRDFENPFQDGTYRQVETVADERQASLATWTANITTPRKYAVYVSYKTLENSTPEAHYTVYHKGGKTHFIVNQKMGGGTWIYLGSFYFDKGTHGKVELSNVSSVPGTIVTADAVKFGGGMGNVERGADGSKNYQNTKIHKGNAKVTSRSDSLPTQWQLSGYPRWQEAARYYLQWAGFPKSVYSPSNGTNDYTDDYRCRGLWVNYLAGGSRVLPKAEGLNIPVEMSLAFHTDGGLKPTDTYVGTLGIYKGNGTLCTTVYNSIVDDIRATCEPLWRGRNCRDAAYAEVTSPKVPAMLLELLSHENFSDMRLGHDPRFKFLVGRSIYKGILKYLSKRYGTSYVVQPLPIDNFAATLGHNDEVTLSWQAVEDSLESTARANSFVVYQRIGDGVFSAGKVVKTNSYTCKIPKDQVVSFMVTALNEGGQSFPSEILSVGIASKSKEKPVLVINGFNRLSAPDDYSDNSRNEAGFLAEKDNGVDYLEQIDYIGKQVTFNRSIPMPDDEHPGYGASEGNYEKMELSGNTFDYPAIHGSAILRCGRSFVSVSRSAAYNIYNKVSDLTAYFSAIDLILGKQKQVTYGRIGANDLAFKTFDEPMQRLITRYCHNGGRIFVSGAFVGSDLWACQFAEASDADKAFAEQILKYKWQSSQPSRSGSIKYSSSFGSGQALKYFCQPNIRSYAVEAPDAIFPAASDAASILKFSDNNRCAGVSFKGNSSEPWRSVVISVPFESLCNSSDRDNLMRHVLNFLAK